MDLEGKADRTAPAAGGDRPKDQREVPPVVDEGGASPQEIELEADEGDQSHTQITRSAESALLVRKESATHQAAYIGEQGAAGEAARKEFLRQQGTESLDLNTFSGRSANFPLLDIANTNGFESVKVKSVESPLSEVGARAYDAEFQKLCSPFDNGRSELAAARLSQSSVRQQLIEARAWPADLPRDSSSAVIAEYVRSNAKLVVPDDHVGKVRETVAKQARALPENYALPERYTAEDIDRLTSRVQPMGITATEIDAIQARSGTKSAGYFERRATRQP